MTLSLTKVSISQDRKNLIVTRVPDRYIPVLKEWGGKPIADQKSYVIFPRLRCYGNVLKRAGVPVDDSFFESKSMKLLEPSKNLDEFFPYQQEAVRFLVRSEHRGSLLALSQGLGKTAVSIEAARQLGFKRILVVAPLTLLTNWVKEIGLWSRGDTTQTFRGEGKLLPSSRWTITNYEMLMRRINEFRIVSWDLVIFDESIRLKSRGTDTWNRAKRLVTPKMWLLSGSPISRDMTDLWAQFSLMLPKDFKSYWRFAYEYMHVVRTEWGDQILGSKDIDFRQEFSDIMHVVNHDEVIDLPKMTFQQVYVTLGPKQLKMYREAQNDFIVQLGDKVQPLTIMSRISQITRLQQIVAGTLNLAGMSIDESVKRDVTIELFESGEIPLPSIVWTHWVPSAHDLAIRLAHKGFKVSLVTGQSENRDRSLQDFIEGRSQILVITSGTGKYGLNLIMAQSMVYVDKSYNFDAYVQSLYRVRRIGLDHTVLVFSIIAENTIDELIHDNLAGKSEDLSKVTNADLITLLSALDRVPA